MFGSIFFIVVILMMFVALFTWPYSRVGHKSSCHDSFHQPARQSGAKQGQRDGRG